MNICFYADHGYWSQLSPNGGTATILHSADTLRKLGHEVSVVASIDRFSWFKHPKPVKEIPKNTDVCIAVTISDVPRMLKRTKAKPFYWARLLENYQMTSPSLLKQASRVSVLVNSEGLQGWYGKHGIDTQIVYQGIDLSKWRDLNMHEDDGIGFLISSKKRKNFDFVMDVVKALGRKYKYYGYGADYNHKIKLFVKDRFLLYVKNAGYADLIRMYNLVGKWVSTSTKEGLHNCPLEAGLCGCTVIYPDASLAGCSDHCIDGKTAWKYKALDVKSVVEAIERSDSSLNEDHKDLIVSKIGSRKDCMKKLIDILKK